MKPMQVAAATIGCCLMMAISSQAAVAKTTHVGFFLQTSGLILLQGLTSESTGEAIVPPEETYMPAEREAVVAHFRNHNLLVERREGMMAIPFMVGAYDQALLETFLQRSIREFSNAYPVEFVEVASQFDDSPVTSVYRRSALVYFRANEQLLNDFARLLGKDFYIH